MGISDAMQPHEFDVVVLGAGAGGMTGATVTAQHGLRTLLIEKADVVGGTAAFSSGTTWIPGNPHLGDAARDDASSALTYLKQLTGDQANIPLLTAFIEDGPQMVSYMENHTEARFRPYAIQADYHQQLAGAAMGGRALEPLPFDGRMLSQAFKHLRPPIPELTLFGGMMVTRGEAATLLRGATSTAAITLAVRLLSRHASDRLRYSRGTRLVLGNALVARLYRSALNAGVTVWRQRKPTRLLRDQQGRIHAVEVFRDAKPIIVTAARGVILAGGGFPANAKWRERLLPRPTPPFTPACPDSTGDTIQLALDVGAAMGPGSRDNALWFPSSAATRKDGSLAVYPHIVLDRAKPGLIAVNRSGERFCNEAISYHEFVRALYAAQKFVASIPAFLICDGRFLWKYGLGMVRPKTLRLSSYVASGYLKKADSIAKLAELLGMDAVRLRASVERHNGFADSGKDLDFNKGETAYERSNGDPLHLPNPCIGRIERGPFFAVEVYPTPLGTSHGLAIDPNARVLDVMGKAIPGLYACGNDADSVFSGEYPGPGAQIGPAMTFAYLAALHLVAQSGTRCTA